MRAPPMSLPVNCWAIAFHPEFDYGKARYAGFKGNKVGRAVGQRDLGKQSEPDVKHERFEAGMIALDYA